MAAMPPGNGWKEKEFYVMEKIKDHDKRIENLENLEKHINRQLAKWAALGSGGAIGLAKLLEIITSLLGG